MAVTDGKVISRGFHARLYGYYVLIKGAGEDRTYFYSHLVRRAPVKPGQRVSAGQLVGNEGKTGNAQAVGCELHFEIRVRGKPIDPKPLLRKWDRTS